MKTKERTDRAIMNMLLDPIRMERIAEAAATTDPETPAEVRRIVNAAAEGLQATFAAFSLMASDLLVITNNIHALPVTVNAERTFCRYVGHEPFRVTNAARNHLVCDLAKTIGVGSYLGVPVTFAGYVLGALCVWEPHRRVWTSAEQVLLSRLAAELTEWWKM